ncbi:MAG: hypothetical protein LUC45_02165, partial [Paraprevotella sp.]|nr:hypothetical protein [Paraprevotella sp.]
MKRYFLLLSLSSGLLGQIQAQSLEECRTEWNESSANVSDNIRYTSLNPSRISFNSQKNKGVAKLDYTIGRGSYRQVDEAQKENNLRFYMGGIKNVGKVDVSGFISYHNIHENDKIWNSTLYLNKDNPFILCDSVASDVTTEAFKMGVTASCAWNEAWKGGISIGLTLGSLSDQTDPRPKTNTTVLPIYIGAEHRLTSSLSVGATAGISFYNSDITYTLVNTLNSYRYFLMKGMGDYYRISSNDVSGYQRAYKGMNYTGALQFVWEPEQGRCKNFTEVRYTHVSENAIDGGSLYKFYGGYYTSNEWMLQNRFLFSPHRGIRHHIVLTAAYHSGEGTWRDQKMMTATEHGNLIYYETLSKYKIQDDQRMSAQLDYRFEQQKGDNPNFFVDAVAGFTSSVYRHQLSTEKAKQEANLLTAKLAVG